MQEKAARYYLIFIGAICGIFALGITLLIGLVIFAFFHNDRSSSKESLIIFTVLVVVDYFFVLTSYRLLLGKERKDGGLFSPTGLTFAGIMFLTFPVIGLITKSWWILIDGWHTILAAACCFGLARFRRESIRRRQQEAYEKNPIPIN